MKRILVLSVLALAACAPKEEMPATDTPVADADVTLAITIATGIEASPASADSVLTANGLTRVAFDALLYRIAADDTKSKQYNARRP